MDPARPTQSPDKSDVKPSFRKPIHDAANRKYRRRSPIGGSDSSSGGSPKYERSHSPVRSFEDDRRRKDNGKMLERDSSRNRSSRGSSDSHRESDRRAYGNSRDYIRYQNQDDDEDRNYRRSSLSGRESRSGTRSDHARYDSNSDRSRGIRQNSDKYYRDKYENVGHRSKNDTKTGEWDKHRDRKARDDRRDCHRSPGDYRSDHGSPHEEMRGHAKDSTQGRDSGSRQSKDTHWSGNKEVDGQKENLVQKRKHADRESDKHREKYFREADVDIRNESNSLSSYREGEARNEPYLDRAINVSEETNSSSKKLKLGRLEDGENIERSASSSKQVKQSAEKATSEPVSSTINLAEPPQSADAARMAAIKAAELVNQNLVGGAYMSTDQKKKLLWGNKKNTPAEESGNRWGQPLFSDRERQEKFNKLMGVKGDVVPDCRAENKDGNLLAEKQEQLQMDLEKQYTAGLRRRDGRTVGLGL